MDRLVVKELIQNDLTVNNVAAELKELLFNDQRKTQLAKDYNELTNILSAGGHASSKAAESIYAFVKQ